MIGALLAGCSAAPVFHSVKSSIPAVAPDKSRIFVYRSNNLLTFAIARIISVDGKEVGDSFSGTAFYFDTSPGKHVISTHNDETKLEIDVKPSATIYVKASFINQNSGFGTASLAITDKNSAENDMHYTNLIETKVRQIIKK